MKFDFTEGEWVYYYNTTHDYYELHGKYKIGDLNKLSDARLIAKVPEMLMALIECNKSILENLQKWNFKNEISLKNCLDKNIKIIESATGKKWSDICKS